MAGLMRMVKEKLMIMLGVMACTTVAMRMTEHRAMVGHSFILKMISGIMMIR